MKNLRENSFYNKATQRVGVCIFIFFSIANTSLASTGGSYPDALAGLMQLKKILQNGFSGTMATIALCISVVGYLISDSPGLAPVLRVLVRIVLACSLMSGGSFLIENVIGLSASTI